MPRWTRRTLLVRDRGRKGCARVVSAICCLALPIPAASPTPRVSIFKRARVLRGRRARPDPDTTRRLHTCIHALLLGARCQFYYCTAAPHARTRSACWSTPSAAADCTGRPVHFTGAGPPPLLNVTIDLRFRSGLPCAIRAASRAAPRRTAGYARCTERGHSLHDVGRRAEKEHLGVSAADSGRCGERAKAGSADPVTEKKKKGSSRAWVWSGPGRGRGKRVEHGERRLRWLYRHPHGCLPGCCHPNNNA
ncbi:hypothetical protein BKA80DRAFT_280805 [Phyllosticta citrichinensis]